MIESLTLNGKLGAAAVAAGVSRPTLRAYCDGHAEFAGRVEAARMRGRAIGHEREVIDAVPVGSPSARRRESRGIPPHGDLGGDNLPGREQVETPCPVEGDPVACASLDKVIEDDGIAAGLPSFRAVAALLWETANDPESRAQGRALDICSKLVCAPVMAMRTLTHGETTDESDAVEALLELVNRAGTPADEPA